MLVFFISILKTNLEAKGLINLIAFGEIVALICGHPVSKLGCNINLTL